MHILIFPAGFILWYLAYEAKPIINDEVTLNWEEKNSIYFGSLFKKLFRNSQKYLLLLNF